MVECFILRLVLVSMVISRTQHQMFKLDYNVSGYMIKLHNLAYISMRSY